MKRLLITSAALVAMTGAAMADVKVGGDGRMGVVYNGDDWNFSSRVRVSFTLSGETDGGLQFGASVRLDQEDGWSTKGAASKGGAGNVWISGEWGKISMGDVVGAAEAALFDLPEIGFTDLAGGGDVDTDNNDNDVFYLTGDGAMTANDNPVLLYQYSAGDLNVFVSMSDGKRYEGESWTLKDCTVPGDVTSCTFDYTAASTNDDQEYAIGANYTFGNYTIGAGYEVLDYGTPGLKNDKHWIIGGTANFGDTSVKLYYGSLHEGVSDDNFDHYGVGVTSKFDAITVAAFVKTFEDSGVNKNGNVTDLTTWGLGASYDLGGGASIVGGIVDNNNHYEKTPGVWKSTDARADIGVKFKF